MKQARAAARERAWLLRAEAGRRLPAVVCAGRAQPGLVIDIDATLVTCHSEKEGSGRDLQARVRLSPDAGLAGQHR